MLRVRSRLAAGLIVATGAAIGGAAMATVGPAAEPNPSADEPPLHEVGPPSGPVPTDDAGQSTQLARDRTPTGLSYEVRSFVSGEDLCIQTNSGDRKGGVCGPPPGANHAVSATTASFGTDEVVVVVVARSDVREVRVRMAKTGASQVIDDLQRMSDGLRFGEVVFAVPGLSSTPPNTPAPTPPPVFEVTALDNRAHEIETSSVGSTASQRP
jgi:hypothetical protein